MFSLEDHSSPPVIPRFSTDMEEFLLTAARTSATRSAGSASRSAASATRSAARVRKLLAVGVAAVVIAVGAVIGIDQAARPSPTANHHSPGPSSGVKLAAYSVATHSDGTVTLSLGRDQIFSPRALRQALAHAGVPALVTVGSVCYVAHPPQAQGGVFPVSAPTPQADGRTVTTITPSLIPAGAELSIGYFRVPSGGGVHITLVPTTGPLTCTPNPPPHP
jgi:hypothetical protein